MSERQSIKLKSRLSEAQILWLEKNIGPRTHWLSHSIGGKGWRAVQDPFDSPWKLEFDKEEYLSFFVLYWL